MDSKIENLLESLKLIETDEELANLGFKCRGICKEITELDYLPERFLLWESDSLQLIVWNSGNGYCKVFTMLVHKLEIRGEGAFR